MFSAGGPLRHLWEKTGGWFQMLDVFHAGVLVFCVWEGEASS